MSFWNVKIEYCDKCHQPMNPNPRRVLDSGQWCKCGEEE